MRHFGLSPSTLGLYKNCPRCFWLHINKGHKRPNGIFPSLPGGMDLVIKKYFDKYGDSLPLEIVGKVRDGERETGIEPASLPWEGNILPVYYSRNQTKYTNSG